MDAPRRPSRGRPSGRTALQISHDGRFVVVHGQRRELSPAEASLLSCLLAHGGEPVSRARLLFALRARGGNEPLTERSVDFAIRRLRLKVEADPSRPTVVCTVRGRGYRLVPPPENDARARTREANGTVVDHLAQSLRAGGTLVQVVGGDAPFRSGLIRSMVDALGAPPPGGVLWIPGRFTHPEDLLLAIARACRTGPFDHRSVEELLTARAPTLLVIDAVCGKHAELATTIHHLQHRAPLLTWAVFSTERLSLLHGALHVQEPPTCGEQRALLELEPAARSALSLLLACPGPVDIDLFGGEEYPRMIEQLEDTGCVQVRGRGDTRHATLIGGAEPLVQALLSPAEQDEGRRRAHELAQRLVPAYRPGQPWSLLMAETGRKQKIARHPHLFTHLLEVQEEGPAAAQVATLALLCATMHRPLMGPRLRSHGRRLVQATAHRPQLQAMVYLALAWLELPGVEPLWTGLGAEGASAPAAESEPSGDLFVAAQHLARATALAGEHRLHSVRSAAQAMRALVHLDLWELATANHIAGAARLESQVTGCGMGIAIASLIIAAAEGLSEQPDTSLPWLLDAIPRLETSGRPTLAAHARAAAGRLQLQRGDALAAHLHLDAALVLGRSTDDLSLVAVAADLLAEVETAAGRPSEAVLRRREACRASARSGDPRLPDHGASPFRAGLSSSSGSA